MTEKSLTDSARAALAAAAVGDAIGGSTEGWEAVQIADHYGGPVEGIVPSIRRMKGLAKPFSPFYKGDGHITDDTLMTRALVKVYTEKRDHLDAFDIESRLVPQLIEDLVWIPELEREDLLYHRLFLAEKWLVAKLRYGHADPREAGFGNIVNCGAAMYIAPVGLANAGSPDGAYAEAVEISGAHQSSYGREAAAVLAAAVAEAVRPGATVTSVVDTALRVAHDGTRAAIDAVAATAGELDGWRGGGLAKLRDAFAPYDSVGVPYAEPGLGARIPSRLQSIEELPLALGMLVATGGDCAETILGGVNYGRDSDSIASMGGALAGALGGTAALRSDWVEEVGSASRYDLEEPGRVMAEIAFEILERDSGRHAARVAAMGAMAGTAQVPA